MGDFFLLISLAFLLVFILGMFFERIRVPWIFAALFLGAALSQYGPALSIASDPAFQFLAQLGMYFLLFIIGFEINFKEMKRQSSFIFKSTVFIIALEALLGSFFIHFAMGYSWLVSILVAVSFATVGEAVLLPILDEFKIIKTKLGQAIIGIATLDDVIEVLVLIAAVALVGSAQGLSSITVVLVSLFALFFLAVVLTKLHRQGERFKYVKVESLFFFSLFVLFLFLAIGNYAHAGALGALLAGLSLKTFIPRERLKFIETEVRTMCYGFFAPVFLLSVGLSVNLQYVFAFPLLVVGITLVSKAAKVFGGYLAGKSVFGVKNSIFMGVALSMRFSTSIVVMKILFDSGVIGIDLYSVIVASTIVFKFVTPLLLSHLATVWNIGKLSGSSLK